MNGVKRKLAMFVAAVAFILPAAGAAFAGPPDDGTNPVANDPLPLVGDAASQPDVVPDEQMTVIDQMIDALHRRDTEAFIDVFAPDGAFNPRGDFAEASSCDPNLQPVAAVPLVGAWMVIIDAWGLEAGVVACNPLDGPGYMADDSTLVQCEVETRWQTLFMEITEGWGFEFRGTELVWWNSSIGTNTGIAQFQLINLEPEGAPFPNFSSLEAWEAWLAANHPEEATRYLNPLSGT